MGDDPQREVGSTLAGRYGGPRADLSIARMSVAAAWNVQGDATRTTLPADFARMFGVPLPQAPNTTFRAVAATGFAHSTGAAQGGRLIALWLGPRSWLLVESTRDAKPAQLVDFDGHRDALNASGGALFDVSASRVAFTLRGAHAGDVLARGCPLDFGLQAFAPGTCAQSVFGPVSTLFYRHIARDAFTLLVARSLSADAWHSLCRAAAPEGYVVAPPSMLDAD
ncbi:MAG: sarcosine oxidase subunit gamma family protein [Casimicrobiaceae bacterium]